MNNKQLAEMIKKIRKIKMEQKLVGSGGSYMGAGADIQDPASPNRRPGSATKEIHHGIKEEQLDEFQTRANPTHSYVGLKVPSKRMAHRNPVSRPLGARQKTRYRLEEKQSSNTKSTVINTTPEQDSAMIGTQ
jgi:hypothetical protein